MVYIDDPRDSDPIRLTQGLSAAWHPELMAAQSQQPSRGPVSHTDDRGRRLLGRVQPVSGTGWWLAAEVDETGVYAPLRARLWGGGMGILAVILLLAMGTGLVLRTQEGRRMQERLFLTQRNAWLMQEALDGILLLDGDGRIQEANAEVVRQLGYGMNELLGRQVGALASPEVDLLKQDPFLALGPSEGTRLETSFRRKDGEDLPVEVAARSVLHEGDRWIVCFVRDITGRRQQELALRRMTQLYWAMSQLNGAIAWCESPQTLFDTICEVLVSVRGLQFVWVAEAAPAGGALPVLASRHGGVQAAEVPPRSCPEVEALLARVIQEDAAWVIHLHDREPGTAPVDPEGLGPMSVAAFPIRRGGEVVAVLGVYAQDTGFFGTAELALLEEAAVHMSVALDHLAGEERRRRTEQALAESEHLLREAQEAGQVGSYAWDILANTWKSSPYLDLIFGIDATYPRDLQGWVGLVEPSHREAMAAYTAGIIARREPFDRDYPIIRPADGQERWVHGQGILRFDAEGRALALVGVIQDITERRGLEHSLRKVSTAVDQSPLSIVITDVSGTIEYVNPVFTQVTGYTAAEAIGQNPRILRSPKTPPAHYRAMWETLARGEVWSGEFENRKKDGTLFLEQAIIAPVRDDQGVATGYIAIKQDVTEARRDASERKLLEAQLQQSQKLESLGSLAGGVAHDMNNVLGAILGLASALQSTADPFGPEAKNLDTIINACMRGRGVVKSLLYFARRDLQEERLIEVNGLVEEITQLLSRTTLQRIKLTLDLADGLGQLRGDPGALSHALMNLCVNAIDAMPQGGDLRIRTQRFRDGSLAILVVDSGQGMTPEVLAKAREPFFTTKPVGKGTGLGLSMVHGTMQAHEGTFDLISQPGEGTEAILHFPASRVTAVRHEAGPLAALQAPAPDPQRILLVDDDELIRDSVIPMLELLGHTVTAAAGGAKALLMLGAGLKVDLVILDMNMPGMSGAETLPRILSLSPGVRVILATGYSEQDVAPLLLNHPGVTSLRKPFSMKELQEAIQALALEARGIPDPS